MASEVLLSGRSAKSRRCLRCFSAPMAFWMPSSSGTLAACSVRTISSSSGPSGLDLIRHDGAAGRARGLGDGARDPAQAVDRRHVHGGGDDRPPRLGEDRLEQRGQQRRVVVDHAGGVDRIGRRSRTPAGSRAASRRSRRPASRASCRRRRGSRRRPPPSRRCPTPPRPRRPASGRTARSQAARPSRRTDRSCRPARCHSGAGTRAGSRCCRRARRCASGSSPGRSPRCRPGRTPAISCSACARRAARISLPGCFSASTTQAITVTAGSSTRQST